jgi:oligo-1,6-glucosidase
MVERVSCLSNLSAQFLREPNNWSSYFGPSAWQYDPASGEYYLHLFSKKQPDLNWENPKVREEVYRIMRWWLDKGVDGFRMDVINMISKAPGLPDATVRGTGRYHFGGQHFINGPRLVEFLTEMKREVLSQYDLLTVGETPMVSPEYALGLTHGVSGQLNMVFQFEHMELDEEPGSTARHTIRAWDLRELKTVMTRWQTGLAGGGWNSNYLSNHDQPRALSRFGDDGQYRVESAKLLATFLHMLQGTPYIYQGEEIGMTNVAFETIDDYRDIETHNNYREFREHGKSIEAAMQIIHSRSRDNARTPVQWSAESQAGFTEGVPWISVNPNYQQINVEQALADSNSIFYYYQQLIKLRHTYDVVVYGEYELLLPDHDQIYAFLRKLENEHLLVILNFRGQTPTFVLPESVSAEDPELLISNYPVEAGQDIRSFTLRPYEARVYRLMR